MLEEDLALKHRQMETSPFAFLRSTFYRWAQRWPKVCPEVTDAPAVLTVGDAHVENFGTWRDWEGRLAWGVNDFDEAFPGPYLADLLRLSVSAHLALPEHGLRPERIHPAVAIWDGYRAGIAGGGRAFVLAEDHTWLRESAMANLRDPVSFWRKMESTPSLEPTQVPESAIAALESLLPAGAAEARAEAPWEIKHRIAGLGSLGRPRFTALMEWGGGRIAREAKATAPSAVVWAREAATPAESFYQTIMDRAVRCHDPWVRVQGNWLVRRLAPDCIRVELSEMPKERDETRLLHAMGWEIANVHLGSRAAIEDIQRDLDTRPGDWLQRATLVMAEDTLRDWRAWKDG